MDKKDSLAKVVGHALINAHMTYSIEENPIVMREKLLLDDVIYAVVEALVILKTKERQELIERVEYHQKMERLARVYKQGTVSYHKAKSEAFQEALAMLEPKEKL